MGYYPKHLRKRRERENLRVIAHAILHGMKAERIHPGQPPGPCTWEITWPDNVNVGHFYGRGKPAALYKKAYMDG